MGTTRIKVIDLSSNQQEIKTSRKHAEKLTSAAKIKTAEPEIPAQKEEKKPAISDSTKTSEEKLTEAQTTEDSQSSKPKIESEPKVAAKRETSVPARKSSAKKSGARHKGKKYQEAVKLVDKNSAYNVQEALELLHKTSITKFDPTVEVHLNVTDKNIRGKVNFPHSVGAKKEKRYLILSDKQATTNDKRVIWGDEKTIAEIETGKIKPQRDFDIVITTPKYMSQLAKVAKILGPKGMMPNPKNGTIAQDPAKVISLQDDNAYEYKTDPTAPIVHTKIGKLSYKDEQLTQNLKALILSVGPSKIKKVTISSTMGPGIKINVAEVGK